MSTNLLQSFLGKLPDEVIDKAMVLAAGDAMLAKLAQKRGEGAGGWHSPQASTEDLQRRLFEHVAKGDMTDVLNLAGMILIREKLLGDAPPAGAIVVKARQLGTFMIANADGTVTDELNGLQWQVDCPEASGTFHAAEKYCRALDLAGHKDWRLPSEEELLSLVDRKRFKPAINPDLFPGTNAAFYWSSTPHAEDPADCAWGVYFNNGYTGITHRLSTGFVRAVRSVAPAAPVSNRLSSFTA